MRALILRLVVLTTTALAILVPSAVHAGAADHPRARITLPTTYQSFGPTDLMDATCPTANLCLAIGDFPVYGPVKSIRDIFNGSSYYSMLYRSTDGGVTWTPLPVPGGTLDNPYDPTAASVAISCGTPTFCVLEYFGIMTDFPMDQFDVSTDGGLTWTLQKDSDVYLNADTPTAGMTSLTCRANDTCLGVVDGQVASSTSGAASWVVHPSPRDVDALSCPSTGACFVLESTAVGRAHTLVVARAMNLGGTLTPVLRVHSSAWIGSPALSCATAADCTVLVPNETDPLLASTIDGGHVWTTHYAPEAPGTRVEALDCPSARDCAVLATDPSYPSSIDSYSTTNGGEEWSYATVWELGFPGATASLSCVATRCTATLGTRSVFSLDLAAHDVPTWTASRESASAPTLDAVACQADGSCLAIGVGVRATSLDDANSWTVQPDGAFAGDTITSLTCPLPSTCFAAGSSGTAAAPSGLLLVTTDLGADWTPATLPWEVGEVSDVQCDSLGTCLALPGFASALQHVPTFVLRSTDGGLDWSLVQLVAAGAGLSLTGVACPTTSCIALGTEDGSAKVETSSDGGATWTAVDPTAGGFSGLSEFFGLSCSSPSDCETAAQSADGSEVDAWGTVDAGASWSMLGTMLTVGKPQFWSTAPTMSSCSSGGVCAGDSLNEVGPERPVLYDTIAASDSGGASWDTFDPPAWVQCVTVAPTGTVIALGLNAENGSMLVAGSP